MHAGEGESGSKGTPGPPGEQRVLTAILSPRAEWSLNSSSDFSSETEIRLKKTYYMKKLLLILAAVAAMLPAAAFADQYNGTYLGYGGNQLSFNVGSHRHNMQCNHGGGNVAFYDEHGAAFDPTGLRRGHPITVHYANQGGHRVVQRVIVRQQTSGHHRGGRGHGRRH